MYFFDASAATAMLAGLAIDRASAKRSVILLAALILCLYPDRLITRTTAPIVAQSYNAMLGDLSAYPTILSDEASINIRSGRQWYWGDPLVLNALGTQGYWNSHSIERGIASKSYSAVVAWNPTAWSPEEWQLLEQNYAAWRTYAAFKHSYTVYLPK